MPIYDYKCCECNFTFSEFQLIDEEPIEKCPKCSGKVKKMIQKVHADIIYTNGREIYEKEIRPEVDRIVSKAKNGDLETISDLFGEDAANYHEDHIKGTDKD